MFKTLHVTIISYHLKHRSNKNGTNKTVHLDRLRCAFAVRMQYIQHFLQQAWGRTGAVNL